VHIKQTSQANDSTYVESLACEVWCFDNLGWTFHLHESVGLPVGSALTSKTIIL